MAPGLKIDFDAVKGLREGLANTSGPVSSIYSSEYCEKTWRNIQGFKEGRAVSRNGSRGGVQSGPVPGLRAALTSFLLLRRSSRSRQVPSSAPVRRKRYAHSKSGDESRPLWLTLCPCCSSRSGSVDGECFDTESESVGGESS